MWWKSFILFQLLCIVSCKEKSSFLTNNQNVDTLLVKFKSELVLDTVDLCSICDSIYNSFPSDTIEFYKLYGYPYGSRQYEGPDDIEQYFICLDSFFKVNEFNKVMTIFVLIKPDVDVPSFLRHYLTEYLIENHKLSQDYYLNLECIVFKRHVECIYSGVENGDYINKLCGYFESLELKDKCKIEIIEKQCSEEGKEIQH